MRSWRKPRNRRGADIVAAAYRAQGFALAVAALDRFALLIGREFGPALEFHAIGFRIDAVSRRALLDALAFELRGRIGDL
jgi:hypothetical protein